MIYLFKNTRVIHRKEDDVTKNKKDSFISTKYRLVEVIGKKMNILTTEEKIPQIVSFCQKNCYIIENIRLTKDKFPETIGGGQEVISTECYQELSSGEIWRLMAKAGLKEVA